jgi:hypothetical protein
MRRTFLTIAAALFAVVALQGCSSMKPEDFAGKEPRFRLEEFFPGHSKATGIFQDRFGNLRRSFEVDIKGTWDGTVLTLVEDFVYDDGEVEQRIWTLTRLDDNNWEGTTPDAIGKAVGKSYGNAFSFAYDFNLKVGEGRWKVHFDDWMWLQKDGSVINRAYISKFGIEIGQATIVFRRVPASAAMGQTTPTMLAAQ